MQLEKFFRMNIKVDHEQNKKDAGGPFNAFDFTLKNN